ncbi:MAG TPA: Hsp70 family protein, partial [Micromonospora sp.]
MPYVLGIDIGGTSTLAAVARPQGAGWAPPEVVRLGDSAAAVPSVLHLRRNGSVDVGEATGGPDGDRTARDFCHRVGDDVPLLLGGEACTPQALTAVLARWVVEQVTAQEYGPPGCVVLSHPSGWGPYRVGLLRQALHEIDLGHVTLLPQAVTVAESHAARGGGFDTAAVYTLGGSTFEGCVVRRTRRGIFELVGVAQRLEPTGGADFDEALAEHVRTVLGREFRDLADPRIRQPLLGLAAECARAKRELSVATETDVMLRLPDGPARIPVTRAAFEEMIEPAVRATVAVLSRAVRAAGLGPEQLDAVLL